MSAPDLVGPARNPAPRQTPRHLRLVGVEELAAIRRRRRVRLAGIAVAAFVIALLFAAVGMHVVLAQNQFRLDQVDAQAAAQQAKFQQLRLQVAELSSPQRILGTAQGRLGMAPPTGVTFLNPTSATPGSPSGAAQSGPAPASAPPGWSTIKPQLVANP
jgi:cell division protein FtsL